MGVVGLVVAIPVTLALRSGDGQQSPISVPDPPGLGALEFDRDLGIEVQLPDGWTRERKGGAVVFRSSDERVVVAVTAPGLPREADTIHDDAVASLEAEYDDVEVGPKSDQAVFDGRSARTTALGARNPESDDELAVLVATARGRDVAYLIEVFAAAPNAGAALAEGQALLNAMRLVG